MRWAGRGAVGRRTMRTHVKPHAIVGTTAKRGDVFVHELERSYTMAIGEGGGTKRWTEYELAVVTGVTREGRVRTYRLAGDTVELKATPAHIRLVAGERVNVPALEAAYAARGEFAARAFKSHEEAREFIRPHLRTRTA